MEGEIWKPIIGYENLYKISNMGNIFSIAKNRKLTLKLREPGYYQIILYNQGKFKAFSIHRLVALHFIKNPLKKPQVNHIDGNKLNNRVDNLEWNTASENTSHAYEKGLIISSKGEGRPTSKLKESDVIIIRYLKNLGALNKHLAAAFDVAPSIISRINTRSIWKHI